MSLSDLLAAAGIDRATGENIEAYLGTGTWAKDIRKISTPDGIITVVQHYVAIELINIWAAAGCGPHDLWGFYVGGAVSAIGELVPDLVLNEFLAYCAKAREASGGAS